MTIESHPVRSETAGFARYCLIGAVGLLIDAGSLVWLIREVGLNPFIGRACSILLALTMCWAMHRNWTFESRANSPLAEWSRFAAVNGVGGGLNYLIYAGVLLAFPSTTPLAALIAGSAFALCANYLGSRFWAFQT